MATTTKWLLAKDLMHRDVSYVNADMSLVELANYLDENKIHGAPVTTSSGQLAGVVSRTDLARAFTESAREDPHLHWFRTLDSDGDGQMFESWTDLDNDVPGSDRAVSEIMTVDVVTVNEDWPVGKIAQLMLDQGVHRVLVTREKQIVGILSSTDLLRALPPYEKALDG